MEKKSTAMLLFVLPSKRLSNKTLGRGMTMLLVTVMIIAGCAATPVREKAVGVLFQHPVGKARDAAIDALPVLGFDVKKSELLYVEGSRPHKIGLLLDSGRETAGIWLEALDPDSTKVYVHTARSSVGYEGQKDWTDEILGEIEKVLEEE